MAYMGLFGFILILSTVLQHGLCDDDEDEPKYAALFSDDVAQCKDFENKVFLVDLALEPFEDEDNKCNMGLSGSIDVKEKIEEGVMMSMNIYKKKSMSESEMMSSMKIDICSSFNDSDAPWVKILEKIGITGCPILVDVYDVAQMTLDLGFMEQHMTSKNEGSFDIEMTIANKLNEIISCHIINFDIDKKE